MVGVPLVGTMVRMSEFDTREEKTMKSNFASRLRVLCVLAAVATALVACGSTSTTTSTSTSGSTLAPGASFKLGVSLTFNNTDFWTNYILYETKFAAQYNATLIGPLVANNDPAKQITDIHTLIQEGAQALIVNPVDSAAIAPAPMRANQLDASISQSANSYYDSHIYFVYGYW